MSLVLETSAGAASGVFTGGKVPGLNAGKGSQLAVAKQIVTKLEKGQIQNITAKTGAKMANGVLWQTGLYTGAAVTSTGMGAVAEKRVINTVTNKKDENQ